MTKCDNRPMLLGQSKEELRGLAVSEGAPAFRGSQLAEWLYRCGARDFDEMANLPAAFRDQLKAQYIVGRSRVVKTQRAADGTVKLLLELGDGAKVETVGLPYADRYSCCVSTQAGCPVGCVFCSTGQSGFKRNLTAGEIVDQVLSVGETVRGHSPAADTATNTVDHVTFMGMGEPLLNYDATVKALRLLNTDMGISARHLTVSTIGYVPGIRSLMKEKLPVTLAVSLHAPNDALRRRLVPGLTKWGVEKIVEACRDYISETGRRVTIEYCLIDKINDSTAEAQELAALLKGLNCHVNLIPFNPVAGLPYKTASPERVKIFHTMLAARGIQVTERLRKGADIDAACGQLRRREAV